MRMDDIDFLIIGATKSATTWLQRSLQADPAVSMPDPELHYFSREHERGDDWYLSQFPDDASAKFAGEKSNSYLESPKAARRIAASLPEAKLVVQLRNPVERAYSDYCMMYRRGEVGRDIWRYLDPRRRQETRLLDAGFYHRQLTAYYDFVAADRLMITFYETIASRPVEQLESVRGFLGLPAQEARRFIRDKVKDKTTPMLGPKLRRLLRPLKPAVASLRGNAVFQSVHRALASEIRYSPLPDDLRWRLVDYYAGDVEALGKLAGRDLSGWLHDPKGWPGTSDPELGDRADTLAADDFVRAARPRGLTDRGWGHAL